MGREAIRALVLAGVYGVWLILATPGVDGIPPGFLRTEKSFEKLAKKIPIAVKWDVFEAALGEVKTKAK